MKKTLVLVFSIFLVGCFAATEYDQNLAKWQDAGISHYKYDLVIGCFCPFYEDMPLTIEVKDGEVISITRADGTLLTSSDMNYQYYTEYATIDLLFAKLESAMKDADNVTVTYEPLYGFPVDIAIDRIELAMDDELSLQITNFEALK